MNECKPLPPASPSPTVDGIAGCRGGFPAPILGPATPAAPATPANSSTTTSPATPAAPAAAALGSASPPPAPGGFLPPMM